MTSKDPGKKAGKHSGTTPDSVEAFVASLDEAPKQAVCALRQIILAADPGIAEGIKWNVPSFRTSEYSHTSMVRIAKRVKLNSTSLRNAPPKDTAIIIIARLGAGEYSRSLNRRRLEGMREYLEMTRGISKDRLIVAEGSRVNGPGQVDFYLGGKLFLRFTTNRNKDLTRGCSTA